MLEFVTGDIFDSDARCIVIPVNCVGVAGAGLAKQFKERYPRGHAQYVSMCKTGMVHLGFVSRVIASRKILLFPTKYHWKEMSLLTTIKNGLDDVAIQITRDDIKSIAFPKLGCGLGGLRWADVKPLFLALADSYLTRRCRIVVYEFYVTDTNI